MDFRESDAYRRAQAAPGFWQVVDPDEWHLFGVSEDSRGPLCNEAPLDDGRLKLTVVLEPGSHPRLCVRVAPNDAAREYPHGRETFSHAGCGVGTSEPPDKARAAASVPSEEIEALADLVFRGLLPSSLSVLTDVELDSFDWCRELDYVRRFRGNFTALRRLLASRFTKKEIDKLCDEISSAASRRPRDAKPVRTFELRQKYRQEDADEKFDPGVQDPPVPEWHRRVPPWLDPPLHEIRIGLGQRVVPCLWPSQPPEGMECGESRSRRSSGGKGKQKPKQKRPALAKEARKAPANEPPGPITPTPYEIEILGILASGEGSPDVARRQTAHIKLIERLAFRWIAWQVQTAWCAGASVGDRIGLLGRLLEEKCGRDVADLTVSRIHQRSIATS